ncbi:MAG: ABC transporter ATP-binding protein [Rickettsiales bacterium]
MSLVSVQHLSKHFGAFTAVDDVSLSVAKGEVLGFLGPNGAGKTTTMRMITGYLEPSIGSVTIDGIDIAKQAQKAKAKIGYLPEGAPLYPDMTARQILHYFGEVRGLTSDYIAERVEAMIALLHLESVSEQTIDTLSKGFKRRVGLGVALLHDPEILILDEPTDGLDPLQKHEVRTLIRQMSGEKAIIISTHILEEVEAVCSRAAIIAEGKIVADGTPQSLLKTHGHASLDDMFRALAGRKEPA